MINKLLFTLLLTGPLLAQSISTEEQAPLRPRLTREAIQQTFGKKSIAYLNTHQGTPHRILVETAPPQSVSLANLPQVARDFVARNPAVYGVAPEELILEVVERAGPVYYVIFRQTYHQIPVYQSRIDFRYRTTGQLVTTGADVYPNVNLNPTPDLGADVALIMAQTEVDFSPDNGDLIVDQPELYVYVNEETPLTYRLGWRLGLYVHHDDPTRFERAVSNYEIWVDAHTGEVFSVFDRVEEDVISGTVTGMVKDLPYGTPTQRPMRNLKVHVDGVGDTYTDVNGAYAIEAGTVPRQVTVEFTGSFMDIDARNVTDASITTTVSPGDTFDVHFDDLNSIPGERDTYYHGNLVHDWMLTLDTNFTGANYSMPAAVNIGSEDPLWPCNAYWDGLGINMFSAGGGCSATDQMADVVYHEYQHGLTQFAYDPFSPPYSSGMGEGFSDYTGMTLRNSPCMGDGFFGTPGGCLRDGENMRQWPGTECGGEVHCLGEITMGALWKMRQNLIASIGDTMAAVARSDTLFRWAMFGRPYSVPDLLLEILIADDDDATILNGTPNFIAITDAFGQHNVDSPIPDFGIDHTPVANTLDTTTPVVITAVISSLIGDITTAQLVYIVRGVTTTVDMTDLGNNQYQASIPPQPAGTIVEYYLQAADNQGNVFHSPENAPDVTHFYLVGPRGAFMSVFEDSAETDNGWQFGVATDDATTGIWERTDPIGTDVDGTPVQPEDDHTFLGTLCFVTGNGTPGGSAGENDVDDGTTTLLSPPIDLMGMTQPVLGYWRWYSNNAGNAPGSDVWVVQVSANGTDWVDLERTVETQNTWTYHQFLLANYITPTDSVRIRFIAEDAGDGSLVEAAVDDLFILNGINVDITFGDLNFDGVLNVADVLLIVDMILGEVTPTGLQSYVADLNGDGIVNILDILALVNIIIFQTTN